jgi:hypothetical protein
MGFKGDRCGPWLQKIGDPERVAGFRVLRCRWRWGPHTSRRRARGVVWGGRRRV